MSLREVIASRVINNEKWLTEIIQRGNQALLEGRDEQEVFNELQKEVFLEFSRKQRRIEIGETELANARAEVARLEEKNECFRYCRQALEEKQQELLVEKKKKEERVVLKKELEKAQKEAESVKDLEKALEELEKTLQLELLLNQTLMDKIGDLEELLKE